MTNDHRNDEDIAETIVASMRRVKKEAEEAKSQASDALPDLDVEEKHAEHQGYPADPDFQLRGGFANLMLDAAAPLFGLVIRLRTLDELPNIKDVHRQVRNQIDNIREEMRQHGYEHTQLLAY
ncbi:DotU family type IV/VI secretion system protein, partial [Pseudomonas sp. CM27]|uniref:DotU family type IV/VI secretion system protein n=1 Tax=Pseudomonas sp. CM27 TaxID=2738452 RepID=UPI001555CB1D